MLVTINGVQKEYSNEASLFEIAKDNEVKGALAAKVDGKLTEMRAKLDGKDCNIEFLTFKDAEGKKLYRHTCSHILAQAIKNIYPTCKLAIGPAIDDGFYYDFDFKTPITTENLAKIEQEMKNIIKANYPLERFELPREEAVALMKNYGEDYKVELINDLPKDATISFYKQGNFTDLCAGPHIPSTGYIKAFKLMSITGAYWRGSEKNKMLTRIYGTCFDSKQELSDYITMLEEAKKRDHNKLGRELKIFTTNEYIGQGLPLLMPKGEKIFRILSRFVEDEEERRGYVRTKTPFMAKSDLYKLSGHWDHYKDGMFVLGDEEKDSEVFALRPMTCPFQYMVYKADQKSYKDLPLRYGETSTLFRNEASGEMHGLIRVRQFTISEGHLIIRPDQLEEEFKGCLDLARFMLKITGLLDDVSYRFSRWDPDDKVKYIQQPEIWDKAEKTMKSLLDEIGLDYKEEKGEAAFYGPKLDIQVKNVFGKEDTLITIQVDMFLAERFDMSYIDENGEKVRPYIIHRTSIGCYERTIALMIEKFAGAFPVWCAPVQAKVLALTDRQADFAKEVVSKLYDEGIRAEVDLRNETLGKKIREARLEKIPYLLVVGDKEMEENSVSVTRRNEGDLGKMTIPEIVSRIKQDVKSFKLD